MFIGISENDISYDRKERTIKNILIIFPFGLSSIDKK